MERPFQKNQKSTPDLLNAVLGNRRTYAPSIDLAQMVTTPVLPDRGPHSLIPTERRQTQPAQKAACLARSQRRGASEDAVREEGARDGAARPRGLRTVRWTGGGESHAEHSTPPALQTPGRQKHGLTEKPTGALAGCPRSATVAKLLLPGRSYWRAQPLSERPNS